VFEKTPALLCVLERKEEGEEMRCRKGNVAWAKVEKLINF